MVLVLCTSSHCPVSMHKTFFLLPKICSDGQNTAKLKRGANSIITNDWVLILCVLHVLSFLSSNDGISFVPFYP